MKKHLSLALAATFGMAVAHGAVAHGAAAAEYTGPGFTGEAYMAENNGTLEKMGTVHVDPAGFRMNMNSQGQSVSSIMYWSKETIVTLMHDQKMFMEIPPEQSGWEIYEGKPCSGYADSKKLGNETLNGRKVEKWRCTGQTSTPGDEAPSDATTWYDRELMLEIKIAEDNGNIFEIRDVKIGRQDASMFKIPDGYQKFDMNAMMQQMMQQQQQQQ